MPEQPKAPAHSGPVQTRALNNHPKEANNRPERVGDKTYTPFGLKLIMNQDMNAANRLFGGRLMEWVDEYAALFCMREIETRQIVTKKISEAIFNEPAHLGDILKFLCRVKSHGTTSITIECLVMTMPITKSDVERLVVQCDVVFVALDRNGRPIPHHYTQPS